MRRTRKGGGARLNCPLRVLTWRTLGRFNAHIGPFNFFRSPKNSVFTSASVFQLFVAVFPPGFVDVTLYTAGANGLTLFSFCKTFFLRCIVVKKFTILNQKIRNFFL